MKELAVQLTTPAGKYYDAPAQAVQLPGVLGSFQVLYNHAPLLAMLEKGVVRIRLASREERSFSIVGGLVEVVNNQVTILAEQVQGDVSPLGGSHTS